MTCIVGIADGENVWLGGDRAAVEDGHYLIHCAQPKVFRRGPFLMGYTSSFRMGQLLQYKLSIPDLPSDDLDFDEYMATIFSDAVRYCLKDGGYTKVVDSRETVGTFLIGVEGRLFHFDDGHNVLRVICGFDACGSGVSVALGAMHATAGLGIDPDKRILMALDAAHNFVTGVRPPFDIVTAAATTSR